MSSQSNNINKLEVKTQKRLIKSSMKYTIFSAVCNKEYMRYV